VNTDVQGHCDPRFAKVADALGRAIADGDEVGAAIAVDIEGETVVDIWGGHADAAKTRPWTADTIVNVWSSTKTVTALAGLMLIDRGLIEPDTTVSSVWPEFGANGKQDTRFRHLLSHSSGVSGVGPTRRRRGPLRLGQVDCRTGRTGAVVGARLGVGLPRPDARPPDR
jgi:CubicO group peptidase (beta-lactamase class C family)